MEIKIVEERTNPLLKRHELRFEVAHPTAATPNRDSVRTELAKTVHASKDRVIIERMIARFGTAVTRGEANVYETAEDAKQVSREHILVRNGLKEKVVKTPAPATPEPAAPAPKAEAPAPPTTEAAAPPAPKHAPTEHAGHAPKGAEAEHAAHAPKGAEGEPAAHPPKEAGGEPAEPAKKGKAHAKKE